MAWLASPMHDISSHMYIPDLACYTGPPFPSFQAKKLEYVQDEVSQKSNAIHSKNKDSYLDSCLVRIDAILSPDTEHFRYPTNLIAQLGLEVSEMEDSLLISGGWPALTSVDLHSLHYI